MSDDTLDTGKDTFPCSYSAVEPKTKSERLARGVSVGRYVVIDFMDAGGMGAVYQAFDPELNRPVALKILAIKKKRSRKQDRGEIDKHRMLREAQALAQLTHPNVVTVYDVGVFQDAIFIAMEFVEGHTLGDWLENNNASWQEVLAKMLAAGRGLSAAHKAGIIHRDFKPGNMMIGDDGRVLVLDFGLARATESAGLDAIEHPEKSAAREKALKLASTDSKSAMDSSVNLLSENLTQAGSVLDTMVYMAPEQMAKKVVDERSDQFSFCVTLYEALFGCRPFSGKKAKSLYRNMKSQKFAKIKGVKIPKWLEDVIDRGLAFDGEARFESMDQLLEALANDPTVVHRELRAKRRRMAAIAGSISLSLLLAGFGIWNLSSKGSRFCQGAQDKLVGIWDQEVKQDLSRAFLQTQRANAELTFARTEAILDERAAQWTAIRTEACEATHVHGEQSEQMLDLRMQCLDKALVEMQVMIEILTTHADPEVLDKAVLAVSNLSLLSYCSNQKALTAKIPLPKDPETQSRVRVLREKLARAQALYEAGRYPDSLSLCMEVVPRAKELGYLPLVAEATLMLGKAQDELSDYEKAVTSLQESAWTADTAGYDELRLEAYNQLIWVLATRLQRLERVEVAIGAAESVLSRIEETGDLKAQWHNSLGAVFSEKADYQKALYHHTQALRIWEKTLGPEHPNVANALNNLGLTHFDLGNYDQAIKYHKRSLAKKIKVLGPSHPDVSFSYNNLGVVYWKKGDLSQSLAHYASALKIAEQVWGPLHPTVARTLNNLGIVYRHLGDFDQSLKYYRRSLEIREKVLGPDHPIVAKVLSNLGGLYVDNGRYQEARAVYARASAICKKTLGPAHPQMAIILNGLALLHYHTGDLEQARKDASRTLQIWEQIGGVEHPNLWLVLDILGFISLAQGDYPQARKHLERALKISLQSFGSEHKLLVWAHSGLAGLNTQTGKTQAAISHFEKALSVCGPKKCSSKERGPHSKALFGLAQILWKTGQDNKRAIQLAQNARELFAKLHSVQSKQHLKDAETWLKEHQISG